MLRGQLQGYKEFIEAGGPRTIPGCIEQLTEEFYGLKVERRGSGVITPLFCYGPHSEREIILVVGTPDRDLDIRRPKDGLRTAEKNRQTLIDFPGRKRYERIA